MKLLYVLGALVLLIVLSTTAFAQEVKPSTDGLFSVNGEVVTKDQFYSDLEMQPVPVGQASKPGGMVLMERLINDMLVMQLAKQKNVSPTEAQINEKIDFIKKQSGANFENMLASSGMTIDDVKKRLLTDQAQINLISMGVEITDEMVKAEFNAEIAKDGSPFKKPKQVDLGVLYSANKAKANKAAEYIKSGKDFGKVALSYSEDPAKKQNNCNYGWVLKGDRRLPAAVVDAALKLKDGQVSGVILGSGKYYIVKANNVKEEVITPFDDVKGLIKEQLAIREGSKKNNLMAMISEFVKTADIQVYNAKYNSIPEQLKAQASQTQPAMPVE